MAKLRSAYHIRFDQYAPLIAAWKNTAYLSLEGYTRICANNRVSTYAMVWSFWNVWNYQISDPTITNSLYIEWLFRDLKLIWPLGTQNIPVTTLGRAKVGIAVLDLTEQNAII